jgi:hypothetical protein
MINSLIGIIASSGAGGVANSYESIATVNVGGGGSASAEFTSIPSTYQHLEVRWIAKAAGSTRLRLQINSDTATNYSTHLLFGDGAAAGAAAAANQDKIAISAAVSGASGIFCAGVVSVLDYKDTNKFKTVRTLSGIDANGSGEIAFNSGAWRSTSAVTSLKFFWDSGNLDQYSSFALYGIKG